MTSAFGPVGSMEVEGRSDGITPDPYDARVARRASGVLRDLNHDDLLTSADIHVARVLGRLGDEPDERVLLAIALAVRAVRHGSVCTNLADVRRLDPDAAWPDPVEWLDALERSPLQGPGKPLRLDLGRLYLERYWRQEDQVARDLLAREAQAPPAVDADRLAAALLRLFPVEDPDHAADQRLAAYVAATRWTSVLGGGPGTGKTTTVARLVALLLDQPGPALRVALAAPTGKAAARLQEAVREEVADLDEADRARVGTPVASTLHRLLGSTPSLGTRFRHHRGNRLPYDVVVVDETSMVSLTLMARLLEALRPDARLVLVGDPEQLASVEAGAVLADLVAGLTARPAPVAHAAPMINGRALAPPDRGDWRHGVVTLGRTWRYGGAIATIAAAIRAGDDAAALEILNSGAPEVSWVEDPHDRSVREDAITTAARIRASAEVGDARGALAALATHRVLCAHRGGPAGVSWWNREVEQWLAEEGGTGPLPIWYVGRPVIITANDYGLGLFNGDTGVVVREPDGAVRVAFDRTGSARVGSAGVDTYAPSRLADVHTVHAMTVHRGQGSQFDRVTFVLPDADSPLATRELIYTAITRARTHVRVVGPLAAFAAAVRRPAARATGLRDRLGR